MQLTGVIKTIKIHTTKKSGTKCLAYTCESTRTGNKFWFLGWGAAYNKAAKKQDPVPTLVEGQEIKVSIEGNLPASAVKVDEKTKKKMCFLPPNPQLDEASKPTKTMLKQAEYLEFMLNNFGPKRIAKAIVNVWAHYEERIEPADKEFFESLATGCESSGACTVNQFPHCAKLVAKYAVLIKGVETALQAAMREPKDEDDTMAEAATASSSYGDEDGPPADISDNDF